VLVVDINCDVKYRSGNTLRFPRVTREPPRTIVLRGLTLATIPAGVSVCFLRWFCALHTHYNYLFVDYTQHLLFTFVMVDWSEGKSTPAGKATRFFGGMSKRSPS